IVCDVLGWHGTREPLECRPDCTLVSRGLRNRKSTFCLMWKTPLFRRCGSCFWRNCHTTKGLAPLLENVLLRISTNSTRRIVENYFNNYFCRSPVAFITMAIMGQRRATDSTAGDRTSDRKVLLSNSSPVA